MNIFADYKFINLTKNMKNLLSKLVVAFSILLLFSCAASYKPISPSNLNYTANRLDDGIIFSYKYDVLLEKGNRKYARKERNHNVKVVAVKITNHSDQALKIGEDIQFFSGNNLLIPMDPNTLKREVKQSTASYLLYMLLTPLKLNVTKTDEYGFETETYSIGYGVGPGVTLFNMAISGTANQNFSNEINNYSLNGTILEKGKTVYGILGFRNIGYDPLKIKVNKFSDI